MPSTSQTVMTIPMISFISHPSQEIGRTVRPGPPVSQ